MCGSFRVKRTAFVRFQYIWLNWVDFQVLLFAARKRSCGKVMFLHLCVISFKGVEGGCVYPSMQLGRQCVCPGVRVYLGYVPAKGEGVVWRGGFCLGVSALGVSTGGVCPWPDTVPPRQPTKRAVRTLLKCIIVLFQVRGWSLEITAGMKNKYGFNTDNINYTDRRNVTGGSWLVPMDIYIK